MNPRRLTITLQSDWRSVLRNAAQRAAEGLSDGTYQGERLNFESPGAFFGKLTERRWAIVHALQALVLTGISKSQVSALCRDIDERVDSLLTRPIEGEWPYLWLDETYLRVRQGGRVVSVAAIIACGVNQDGRREIQGLGLGESEAQVFWVEFLRSLRQRGLTGLQLVISDAHEGLKAAIAQVFSASWQRCRVHFMRNLLACVPKASQSLVGTLVR